MRYGVGDFCHWRVQSARGGGTIFYAAWASTSPASDGPKDSKARRLWGTPKLASCPATDDMNSLDPPVWK